MKKVAKSIHLAVIFGLKRSAVSIAIFVLLVVPIGVYAQHFHQKTKKSVVVASVDANKKRPAPTAATHIPAPPPIPKFTLPPPPAPKPAPTPPVSTRPAAAPAAVSSSSAAPQSVSSLTPSSGPSTSGSSGSSSSTSTSYTSTNWAGYMATGATYTAISGAWVIPSPTANGSSNSADASWIGIGGVNTSDLIQVGTENTVDSTGKVSSAVFYELLPAGPVYPSTIIVKSGDAISASLKETSPGAWLITITDTTTGQTFSTTVSYSSSHSSGEWIEEDPSYSSGSLVPLDYFGSVAFSSGLTTASGASQSIQASNAGSITLVNKSGATLVQPSSLGVSGQSFTATRTALAG